MLSPVRPAPASSRLAAGLACLVLGLGLAGTGGASEISDHLDRMARQLVDGYHAKHPNGAGETLAVLPFNSTETLAKQRVGSAVAELLTQRLVSANVFRVVERDQLRKVLEEQSLGMTGVIETSSATSVGRLVGAAYLVVGSVDRLGSHYELNARLLDATTADVVASASEEVPAQAFEAEAKPYLVLVPDVEVIGIYLAVEHGGLPPVTTASPQSSGLAAATLNGTPSFGAGGIGVGLRYEPVPWGMVDVTVGAGAATAVASVVPTYAGTGASLPIKARLNASSLVAGSLNWVSRFSPTFRCLAGAGCAVVSFSGSGARDSQSGTHLAGGAAATISIEQSWAGGPSFASPFARAGVEWRPQPRLGLSLLVNLEPVRHSLDVVAEFDPDNHSGATRFTLATLDFPVVTADLAAALYF